MLQKRRGRPTLETYDVLFELARGGMGVVYAGRTKDGRGAHVAIKLMSEGAIEQRKHVDMFLDEVWIASCVRHEHVVEVLDAGEHEGLPFLVMEFVPGLSLVEVLRGASRPPLAVTCAILAATARGLHAAHETLDPDGVPLHIVHRDVSPHNVLVGFDGRVKVTDFGVAAARGRRTHTTSGEIKGKLSYMAPEQITREQLVDRRADVWALGVIAWEALAGRKLFTGADDAQRMFSVLRHPIPELAEVAPETPAPIAAIVHGALCRDVERRVPDAASFARAMEGASATQAELAAWMHAHHGARASALEESFRTAAQREPTAVTAVLRRPVARIETSDGERSIDIELEAEPEPRPRPRRAAAWIGLALLALTAAGAALGARFMSQDDEAVPALAEAPSVPAPEMPAREITTGVPPQAADAVASGPRSRTTPVEIPTPEVPATGVTPPPSSVVAPALEVAAAPPVEPTPSRGRRVTHRARSTSTSPPPSAPSSPPVASTPAVATPAVATPAPERRAGTRLLDNPFARP